ncbi:MAG: YlxR family protein [Bacilli bacterium]|jgi:predicted RNA-binding protein YlxR (DUF448 family)|nr:YlxR family protein [Bacillota bacterium]NLM31367.1 YlxR family protein [Acholeplasmataceae bacterium]HOA78205.1 YlxR family protein [Bacilli bacterium]HPZ26525.1 YlxR family protein [Bacilli bacterium]HQC88999.1 YlxR family protein [Bacilli bacterium]
MMKKKKIPIRHCVATNEKHPKNEMFRIVRTTEGSVEIDPTGKLRGRGAYLSKQNEAIQKARKSKILDKHLGVSVPSEIYDRLTRLLKEENARE